MVSYFKKFFTLEPAWHFTKLSTWPLLTYPLLTISYTKFIFHFHYKAICVHSSFGLRYWMVFCNLVYLYPWTCISQWNPSILINTAYLIATKQFNENFLFKKHSSIMSSYSLDTGRKFKVLKTFRRCPCPWHLPNVLRTFNLRLLSKGVELPWPLANLFTRYSEPLHYGVGFFFQVVFNLLVPVVY